MQNPTKKVKIFGGVVALGVVSVMVYPHLGGLSDLFKKESEVALINLDPIDPVVERGYRIGSDEGFFIRQKNTQDTDGDGLLDWEEELWQTDPNNKDTDGDGTPDGEEVRKKRNPLVAGPADFIVSGSTADFLLAQRESGPQPGNLSDQVSQGLFTTYVAGQEGESSGEEQAQQIVDIAEQALAGVTFQDFYTPTDFQTTPATDLISIKKYGNDFAQAQTVLLVQLSGADGSESGKETFVSTIYRSHARALGEMSVPEPLLETHVLITNTFANLASNLYNVEEYDLDPAKAIFSLQQYDILRVDLENAMLLLPAFFRNNGIVFNNNEPGILWNQL